MTTMKMARMVGSVLTSKITCPVILSDVLALEWCSKKTGFGIFCGWELYFWKGMCIQAFFFLSISVGACKKYHYLERFNALH